MNGQSPSSGEPNIIGSDETIRYGEKKKLSLTLPLLNVVRTNTIGDDDDDGDDEIAKAANESELSKANKKQQIYESDDTFIQAIFSQTIKSTTATPTDDEPSQSFDAINKAASSKSQPSGQDDVSDVNDVGDATNEPTDTQPRRESKEPAAVYTYFHQTIEEDDDSPDLTNSPTIDDDQFSDDVEIIKPINTLTTKISTQNQSQDNICTELKDDSSETHQSFDNSLNNKSTVSASNEAISDSEHSLNQLSLDTDVSNPECKSIIVI